MTKNKKYLSDVDVAIGIAISLVVYGHLLFNVKDLDWFVESRKLIYKFHMPLFMFFSGLLMAYSFRPLISRYMYGEFLIKKAKKFVPPYILFSFIFLIFDYFFYGLDKTNVIDKVKSVFIYPAEGPAGFLWYIYILFEFYLILPLLMLIAKKYPVFLLVASIILQFVNVTKILNLNMFSFYFLFISLGIMVNNNLDVYYKFILKWGIFFIVAFTSILVVEYIGYYKISKTIIGLLSIPAIHFISIKISHSRLGEELALFGKFSFYIYLMNTLIMGALFIVFTKGFQIKTLELISPILFLAGVYVPIFIYNKIISKVHLLKILIP